MNQSNDAVDWLQGIFLQERKNNSTFSLRSFAKKLNLSPGPLSEILCRKRSLTKQLGNKIADALDYSPSQRIKLIGLIDQNRSSKKRRPIDVRRIPTYKKVSDDQYRLISDWYHFAILSYLELESADLNRAKIAQRIGISTVEVTQAIDRLLRLGLITSTDDGFIPTYLGVRTNSDHSLEALRRAHRDILTRAISALDSVDPRERDITSITLAIDPTRIPKAKKRIRRFRRGLGEFLEGGKRRALYHLNIQLVPLTPGEPNR